MAGGPLLVIPTMEANPTNTWSLPAGQSKQATNTHSQALGGLPIHRDHTWWAMDAGPRTNCILNPTNWQNPISRRRRASRAACESPCVTSRRGQEGEKKPPSNYHRSSPGLRSVGASGPRVRVEEDGDTGEFLGKSMTRHVQFSCPKREKKVLLQGKCDRVSGKDCDARFFRPRRTLLCLGHKALASLSMCCDNDQPQHELMDVLLPPFISHTIPGPGKIWITINLGLDSDTGLRSIIASPFCRGSRIKRAK